MNSKYFSMLVVPVVMLSAPAVIRGATHVYDLKNDWSDTANPNGAWSYRSGDVVLTSVLSASIVGEIQTWGNIEMADAGFYRNSILEGFYSDIEIGDICVWTASEGIWGCADDWPCYIRTWEGSIFPYMLRDDSARPRANACWTAPLSGTISVSGSIWPGTCGVFWILTVKGNVISEGSTPCVNSITRSSPFDLALGTGGVDALGPIAVSAGDQVVLTVGSNNHGLIPVGANFTIVLNDESDDPVLAIETLATMVYNMNLQNGIENSLDSKLDTALAALEDANVSDDGAACNSLSSFISAVEAQRNKKITNAQADQLVAEAQAIRSTLGCPN